MRWFGGEGESGTSESRVLKQSPLHLNAHTTAEDADAKQESGIHDLASLAALETRVSQLESDLGRGGNTDSGPAGDEKEGPAGDEKEGSKASTHESAPPGHVLGHYGNKLGDADLQVQSRLPCI
jgi:hypothetical protein